MDPTPGYGPRDKVLSVGQDIIITDQVDKCTYRRRLKQAAQNAVQNGGQGFFTLLKGLRSRSFILEVFNKNIYPLLLHIHPLI